MKGPMGLKTAIFHRRLCLLWGLFQDASTLPHVESLSGESGEVRSPGSDARLLPGHRPHPLVSPAPTACGRLPVPAPAGGAGTRADEGPAVLTPILSSPRCMSSPSWWPWTTGRSQWWWPSEGPCLCRYGACPPAGERGAAGPRAGRWEASETAPAPGRRAQAMKQALGKAGEAFSFSPRNVES